MLSLILGGSVLCFGVSMALALKYAIQLAVENHEPKTRLREIHDISSLPSGLTMAHSRKGVRDRRLGKVMSGVGGGPFHTHSS